MIVFQKNDSKYLNWSNSLEKLGVVTQAVGGSPIFSPIKLLSLFFSRERPKVYVFRYLNDYSSVLKTLVRLASEMSVIVICRVFGMQIWWILHNVDRETEEFHPWLTKIRRKIIKKNSNIVFTTSPFLIEKAKEVLNIESKLDFVSLGVVKKMDLGFHVVPESLKELEVWLNHKDRSKSKFIFCVGTNTAKSLHFNYINKLLEELNTLDKTKEWYAVVIGAKVSSHIRIWNHTTTMHLEEKLISEFCDYYFRVLNDFSVSYTLYEACQLRKPIITMEYGIMAEIISHYNIGFVLKGENYKKLLEEIQSDSNYQFEEFLIENNWEKAAQKFSQYYFK